MTATLLGLTVLAFLLGLVLGRFERADRRIERQAPLDLTPSLRQIRAWRSERR
jgi:hypothetical protein